MIIKNSQNLKKNLYQKEDQDKKCEEVTMMEISITRDLKRIFEKKILTLTCRGLKRFATPKMEIGWYMKGTIKYSSVVQRYPYK